MKIILLFILSFSAYSQTCTPWIPISRAQAIVAATSVHQIKNIPNKRCDQVPEEECICSEGEDLRAAKIETRFIVDPVSEINIEYKVLVQDTEKKVLFDAELTAAATLEAGMNAARKAQECGKETKAYMLVRNAAKGLTEQQIEETVVEQGLIVSLLDSGSLVTAKTKIGEAVADGIKVTEADKTALINFITNCQN